MTKCPECQFEKGHSQGCSKYVGSKAPQGCPYPIHNLIDDRHENCGEAPTDEGWEKEFDKREWLHTDSEGNFYPDIAALKSFIASTVQKEREKGYEEGRQGFEHWVEQGKSEAFSLVRKLLEEMIDENDDGMWGGRETVDTILLRLSTLEGK